MERLKKFLCVFDGHEKLIFDYETSGHYLIHQFLKIDRKMTGTKVFLGLSICRNLTE